MRVDFQAVTLAAPHEKLRVVNQYIRRVTCDATGEYERENMYPNGREQWDWERDGARSGPDGRARGHSLPERRKRESGAGGDPAGIRIFAGRSADRGHVVAGIRSSARGADPAEIPPPRRVGQQRRRCRASTHAFRGRHRNDACHQSSGRRATDASLARSVESQRAIAHHQRLVGGSTPRTPRHERSPVRAAEIPWHRRLRTVETADERVYVRAGAEAGGNGSHRELPPSRRGSDEYLERQSAAAHRQADPPRGEAVHAEFKTGRHGVPVSRDLSRGGTSLRRILRQVQARQV